ncbi:hypothetical protein L0Y59_03095 [Candidatus Uhrbacteria bacterium]|nr:hypothetical protein [Candidatus Uhrbacteria bacterium]
MATITILQNTAIPMSGTAGRTSTVGEPSLSAAGDNVFFTGNWYAAQSSDRGSTWTHVDPFNTLPPVDGGFCCDQTSIYVPQVDLTVWILQYVRSATSNVLRIAVRTPGGNWRFWDIRPTNVNPDWTNQWFDYNSAALSDNFLYVTSNVFTTTTNDWTRAVVLRIRVSDLLRTGPPLPFQAFSTTRGGSLRCTLGARSVMYFGTHESTSKLRLFTWPESATSVTTQTINVNRWNNTTSYSAKCVDGNDWMSRTDGRITAAWTGAGEIGFAWTSNRMTRRPFPFVRAVRINESTKAVIAQPDIWNTASAFAYPDVCPNGNGVPAVSLFFGGGAVFPSHVIGVLDAGAWKLQMTRAGTNAPADGKWGDYVTIRRRSPDDASWIAAGYTLQGGPNRSNIEPQFVHFGI